MVLMKALLRNHMTKRHFSINMCPIQYRLHAPHIVNSNIVRIPNSVFLHVLCYFIEIYTWVIFFPRPSLNSLSRKSSYQGRHLCPFIFLPCCDKVEKKCEKNSAISWQDRSPYPHSQLKAVSQWDCLGCSVLEVWSSTVTEETKKWRMRLHRMSIW